MYTPDPRQGPPTPEDSPLIFLHVPKTAGTTLWLILQRQYSPRAVLRIDDGAEVAALKPEQWDQVRVLLGHLAYGQHHFRRQPACVTVLREPLERALSQYCHWARVTETPLTLGEYLDAGMPGMDNLQTRMLAGPEAQALPFGQCGRDAFEAAKRHLTEDIAVAGLTERFDETLMLLQRRFGWDMPCYVPENVGGNRIRREDVPRDLLRKVWEMTAWDRALYALAAARLDARIAQEGPAFAASLRRFRVANVRYRRMKALVAAGPLQALKGRLALGRQRGLETTVRHLLDAGHRHGGRWAIGERRDAH